jgi:hypothetical protein
MFPAFIPHGRQPTMEATTITPNDVLCGKDKTYGRHPGNQVFRQLIEASAHRYGTAQLKQEKMDMTQEIVQNMKEIYHARFLTLKGGEWHEISFGAARDKVSHALRFAAKQSSRESSPVSGDSNVIVIPSSSVFPQPDRDTVTTQFPALSNIVQRQQELLRHQQGTDDLADYHDITPIALSRNYSKTASEEQSHAFDTLRSSDMTDLLASSMDEDEWEIVRSMAQS